ncbi:response regulator [Neobacillus niacini]|uniref:response regulator transcription factor n=1 Tax=Neobacillus niacini TaxID=86668 RepID=UPI0007AB5B30|nr:response regulator [Neobacillus niacini]MEC1522221.1 response regulator [Neobacillus niacini]
MIKVMIIEDEKFFRESFERKLNKFQDIKVVSSFENTREAKVKLTQLVPDVIFSDIRMPGENGIEFLAYINHEIKQPVKYVLVSGYADFAYAKRAMQLGAFDFLEKPIVMEELEALIHRIRKEVNPHYLYQAGQNNSIDDSQMMNKAKDWILTHLEVATLDNLAQYLQMNSSALSRKFKKETGMSFIQFVTQERMKYSKQLLNNPLIKIQEIAKILGYEDQRYFTEVFKKHFQLSPQRYRQIKDEQEK